MGASSGGAMGGAAGGAAAGFAVGGPWGAAIGGALGLVQGLMSGNKEQAQARIQSAQQQGQYIVSSAQAQAQNLIGQNNALVQNMTAQANNVLASANEQVGLYVQSLNNQRRYKASGDAYNALQETIGRYSDDYARGGFQQRLQSAEMLGRATAELSSAGVGGTTAQLINRTMNLQFGIAQEEDRIGNRTAMWEFAKQRGALTDQALDASASIIQRDMTGYDANAGLYFSQNVVGPAKPVGGYDPSSGLAGFLNSALGAGTTAYGSVKGLTDMYKAVKSA